MTLFSKRIIFGALSITIIVLSALFSLTPLYQYDQHQSSSQNFAFVLIFSYNAAIVFSWLAFGIAGSMAITAISIMLALLLNLKVGFSGSYILIFPYLLTSYLGYRWWNRKNGLYDTYRLKLEKIGEDIIVLSNSIKEKKESISSVEEKLKRYAALKEVIDSFSTQLMLDEVNKLIIEKTVKILAKPGRVLLYMVDTEKQELLLSASRGETRVEAKRGDMFDHWVLKNRKSLIIEDITTDFRFFVDNIDDLKGSTRSIIVTPLISGDKVIGILRMDCAKECSYTQDDLRLLDIIADLGAVAVENALLYARTQELAIRDSLTGLAVRRYFLERLSAEVKRASMKKGKFAILMLDIDRFKNYNDEFGHAAGDIVLKHIAKTVSSKTSEGDIVARYGGEEVVVLLCGKSKKDAVSEAEAIRAAIRDNPISLRRHAANVTVSIGIAYYPDDAAIEEDLIRIADERLYKAKAAGRDRVCSG